MKPLLSGLLSSILLLVSRLPMFVLYLIADVMYIVLYKLSKYRLKVVRENLKNSFPEKSPAQLKQIERRYYRYLADLIVETVKGFTAGRSFFLKRIRYADTSILKAYHQKQQTALLLMGHCGNWEWICRSVPFFTDHKMVVAYKPLRDQVVGKLMNRVRSEFGTRTISMSGVGRYLQDETQKPYIMILVSDQTPSDAHSAHWLPFLNQDTPVLNGPEKLALRYKLPVLFASVRRYKRGHYTITVKELIKDKHPEEKGHISRLHSAALEQNILDQPEIWLWSHRRWKLKR